MQKQSTDRLTLRNACAIIVVVHISNTIVLGYPSGVGSDTWVSYLLATLGVVPLMLLYARLVHLMPGKDLFEMLEFAFGRVASIVLSGLYAVYFLSLSAIVRGYYAEFVHIVALVNTSLIIILLSYFVVCVYLAKSGSETLGKWSTLIVALSLFIALSLTLLSIPKYELRHLLPFLGHSLPQLAKAGLDFLPLPVGEAVLLLTMANGLEKKANPYKVFVFSGLITVLFFVLMFTRNCAVLGEKMMETANFTSYKAASVIHVGSIGTRIESMVAVTFILTGITKVAACLYAGAKAVKNTLRLRDHNSVLLSVGLFSVALSVVVFYNVVQMYEFVGVYRVWATPFQMLIPLILWIVAEVRVRRLGIPVEKGWRQASGGGAAER